LLADCRCFVFVGDDDIPFEFTEEAEDVEVDLETL
jgi:hypothetical protein